MLIPIDKYFSVLIAEVCLDSKQWWIIRLLNAEVLKISGSWMFSSKWDCYTTNLQERIVFNFICLYLCMYEYAYLKAQVHRGQMKVSTPAARIPSCFKTWDISVCTLNYLAIYPAPVPPPLSLMIHKWRGKRTWRKDDMGRRQQNIINSHKLWLSALNLHMKEHIHCLTWMGERLMVSF